MKKKPTKIYLEEKKKICGNDEKLRKFHSFIKMCIISVGFLEL